MFRLFAGALCLLLLPQVAWAEIKSKTVRDWTGTCDDYSCKATVTGEGGLASGGTGYQLEIARASGGNETWFVTIIARNVSQPENAVTFEVPGLLTRDTAVVSLGDDRFGLAGKEALEAIFPALRKGDNATIRYEVNDAEVEESFSLSGIAAVLLWIDDMQGQVGNSDRVAAYEDLNANVVAEDERAALKAQLLAASPFRDCQSALEGDGAIPFEPKLYDLGGGYKLYVVQCTMGAYQPSTLVFRNIGDVLDPVPFASYGDETGWGATLWLGEADYDPATKTLHHYARFRGMADCGTWSDFQWTGYDFKLLRYAYKACSDEPPGEDEDIGDFPIIYEAK